MIRYARLAAEGGAAVVVFPELSLTGYPPQDLVEKPAFLRQAASELQRLASETAHLRLTVIRGTVEPSHATTGARVLNLATVIARGAVQFQQQKMLLPTYDVFDDARYFLPAEKQDLVTLAGSPVALTICEDAWNDKQYWERRLYRRDPVDELARRAAPRTASANSLEFTRVSKLDTVWAAIALDEIAVGPARRRAVFVNGGRGPNSSPTLLNHPLSEVRA